MLVAQYICRKQPERVPIGACALIRTNTVTCICGFDTVSFLSLSWITSSVPVYHAVLWKIEVFFCFCLICRSLSEIHYQEYGRFVLKFI